MENPNSRLEAFCDGVFAIALTLLIIEIKVPSAEGIHTKEELWSAFVHQWPSWFAFLMSFITILISWVNHSQFLKLIDKTSTRFKYANGLLLLSITMLPFPTAAVAEYMQTDMAGPAVTFYCAVTLLNNIGWNLIDYAARHPESLFKPNVIIEKIKETSGYLKAGFGVYTLALVLSFWFPITAFLIISLSFLLWLVLGIAIKEEQMTR